LLGARGQQTIDDLKSTPEVPGMRKAHAWVHFLLHIFHYLLKSRPRQEPGLSAGHRLSMKAALPVLTFRRMKVSTEHLTLIKVGPLKVPSLRAPGPQLARSLCRSATQMSPPIPASADSPHLKGCLPSLPLFCGSAVAEKGGREVAGWVPSIKVGLQAFNFN